MKKSLRNRALIFASAATERLREVHMTPVLASIAPFPEMPFLKDLAQDPGPGSAPWEEARHLFALS